MGVKKVELNKDKQGGFSVNIDGVNFGLFDQLDLNGLFCFFPKRTDRLTGNDYIAIGEALNDLNKSL